MNAFIDKWMDNFRTKPVATVAINMRPVAGPWGGSSPFVSQIAAYLRRRGYVIRYDLNGSVDAIILIDPREDLPYKAFGMAEIVAHKRAHPKTIVIHRVNECDARKSTDFMDRMLAEANRSADYTVFISEWLHAHHSTRWFDSSLPNSVIYNGADGRVFHPVGSARHVPGVPLRVVTHHWSNNPMKGFDIYDVVDKQIHRKELEGVELWVIGRWPKEITWKAARTFPPSRGAPMAELLRQCHLYLTATRWEPCGMHHIEGAQCGLPLVYHRDGGGVVEAGRKYGVEFAEDVGSALRQARDQYEKLRSALFAAMPSGDRMCLDYAEIIQSLLANR